LGVIRELPFGESAAAQIFLNGLVRAAWNCIAGVDADGNPVRYQWGAYVGMQNEWAISY